MRVFRRVFVLLSVLITALCVTAAVFTLQEHREIVKNSFRAHALFLAEQVERLVLWDDRVSLRGLLTRLVDEQSVVAYAFVEKSGVPFRLKSALRFRQFDGRFNRITDKSVNLDDQLR